MMLGWDSWEVRAVEHLPSDCNWKVVVRQGKWEKTVYFYHPVKVGEFVRLR